MTIILIIVATVFLFLGFIAGALVTANNEDTVDHTTQRKAFPDLQFGTLHHHRRTSAFRAIELSKEIGQVDKKK
tara:strand:- start:172 stop:393 length:222 start_codon:yes stop_codon:yes gene_type:complete